MRRPSPRPWRRGAVALFALAVVAAGPARAADAPPAGPAAPTAGSPAPAPAAPAAPPRSALDLGVYRLASPAVVDADTIKVLVDPGASGGEPRKESVRVCAVDAEEVFHDANDRRLAAEDFAAYAVGRRGASKTPVKFGTPAGEEAKAFATRFFAGVERVRLELEEPGRDRDGYGRLLAHVFVEKDGQERLFAEELVRAGWAPYFVKYGRSVRFDARFVAAQAEARAAHRGIWGASVAHYPDYEERLAWWEGRARQVDAWLADTKDPAVRADHVRLGDPADTARLQGMRGRRVVLFGSLDRVEEESSPARLLLVDAPRRPFAVLVPDAKVLAALDRDALASRFLRVTGTVTEARGRLVVTLEKAEDLSTR